MLDAVLRATPSANAASRERAISSANESPKSQIEQLCENLEGKQAAQMGAEEMNIEEAYRTLDLKPGATLKQVVEARDDLLALWDPDRLTRHPRLRSKAAGKIEEIRSAYTTVMERLGESGGRRGEADAPSSDVSPRSSASLFDEVFAHKPAGKRWNVPPWAIFVAALALAAGIYFLSPAFSGSQSAGLQPPPDSVPPVDESPPIQNNAETEPFGATEQPAEPGPPPRAPESPTPEPAAAKPPQRPSGAQAAQPSAPSGRRPVLVRRDAESPQKTTPPPPEAPSPETQAEEAQRQAYESLLAASSAASRLVDGDFENLRFLQWEVVQKKGAEIWIDLSAERPDGSAVHFVWSVNGDTSTVRPLSAAARELERSGFDGSSMK